jgi:tetratricopeptide (TPR) repeat protein
MKLMFLFLLLLMLTQAFAHESPIRSDGGSISYATEDLFNRRGELEPPPSLFDLEELNHTLFSDLKTQSNDLKRIKYYLINGEIRMVRMYLTKLTYTHTKLRPVINRYLAILSFIEGDFEKSYNYISTPELQSIPQYAKICVLKVLSQIVLSKLHRLEENWARCQIENPGNFQERNLIWLDTLVELKLNPRAGVTRVPFKRVRLLTLDNEELKVVIKLALYLNQEKLLADQLAELSIDQLQDPEVRELAGHVFFRTGSLAKSYRFVEDLKSPNAENIKGNLYVLRKKYEVAYAQFKLALEQKQNSQNALERLLPIAWLLGDWESGAKYAQQVLASPQTMINKSTLVAAFLMQKGEYNEAAKILDAIAMRSRRGADIDVAQLSGFTALMQNKPDIVTKQAEMSCSQYDITNCWVLFQVEQWENFPLVLRREDKLEEKREWETLTKEEKIEPLQETVYVNQLDIEELDDKLIQLIPKT